MKIQYFLCTRSRAGAKDFCDYSHRQHLLFNRIKSEILLASSYLPQLFDAGFLSQLFEWERESGKKAARANDDYFID